MNPVQKEIAVIAVIARNRRDRKGNSKLGRKTYRGFTRINADWENKNL
jgi:hypothetical protein